MSRIPRISSAIASALALAGSAEIAARQVPAPAVAVVGFAVDSASRLSPKATEAMTDKLAIDLVESGRFRVLDRAWLGGEAVTVERLPLARVRDAANDAGVDYLIVGRVSKFSERLPFAVPGPRVPPSFGTPFAAYGPVSYRPAYLRIDNLRVSIEIVDTKTGSILTETSSTCPLPAKSTPRVTPRVLMPVSPVAAAVAAIARSRKDTSSLDPGLERALTTAGQVIARWSPPASDSK